MSSVQTIDLFKILDDRQLLAQLHALQLERCDENALTGGDRPSGMRLSCADPVRRVKAALDSWWATTIDDGVGARGHALEAFLEVALFHDPEGLHAGLAYRAQQAIQWHEHGRSAFDFVIDSTRRVISCKTSIKDRQPSSANVAQERRMMALAGYQAGAEFDIWMIDPGTFRAVGPFTYTLEQAHIDAAIDERHGVDLAHRHFSAALELGDVRDAPGWNSPEFWEESFALTSTSGAFRYEVLDASAAVEKRNRAYLKARRKRIEAEREEAAEREIFEPHVREQIEAAKREGIEKPVVKAYGGGVDVEYKFSAKGSFLVTERPREPADAPAAV